MDRLGLYLFRHLLVAFAFATGIVSFVILFTQSFRILSLVIDNSSTLVIFFQLMGLMVPTILPLVLPLGLGIAVLFIYHKLAVDSELVVMRAAGVSPTRLAVPALALAACVMVACLVLTLWIAPIASRTLVALQYQVRGSLTVFLSHPGSFNDLTDGLTFYARKRGAGGTLQGILIHDVRKPETPVTIMAETGQVMSNNDQPQIVVFNGRRQEMDMSTGHLSELAFDQYVLDLDALRSASPARLPDAREQTVSELLSSDSTRTKASPEGIFAELNQRFALPFLPFTYTMVGLIALLAGEFNRRGMGQRLVTAGIAIVVIEACFMSLNSFITKHIDLVFVLYAIPVLPVILGMLILIKDAGPKTARSSLPSGNVRMPS